MCFVQTVLVSHSVNRLRSPIRPGSAASARSAAAEAAVGPQVDPGVRVGVALTANEVAALLRRGGGSTEGREADNDTAGSGIELERAPLDERISFTLAAGGLSGACLSASSGWLAEACNVSDPVLVVLSSPGAGVVSIGAAAPLSIARDASMTEAWEGSPCLPCRSAEGGGGCCCCCCF